MPSSGAGSSVARRPPRRGCVAGGRTSTLSRPARASNSAIAESSCVDGAGAGANCCGTGGTGAACGGVTNCWGAACWGAACWGAACWGAACCCAHPAGASCCGMTRLASVGTAVMPWASRIARSSRRLRVSSTTDGSLASDAATEAPAPGKTLARACVWYSTTPWAAVPSRSYSGAQAGGSVRASGLKSRGRYADGAAG